MNWRQVLLRKILIIFVVLIAIPAYLRLYNLSGTSIAPSVLLGDRLIVNRAAYALMLPYSQVRLFRTGSPKRGDLVLAYLTDRNAPVFKRVMGLPGDAACGGVTRKGTSVPACVPEVGKKNEISPVETMEETEKE